MQLYDTARRAIVAFEPNDHVLMYTCGITPYDATHLGHAATFIAYDVLQRRLLDLGHTIRCIRNVTDVDDPLFAKARELGVHYLDLAAGEEARFERDMAALNAMHARMHQLLAQLGGRIEAIFFCPHRPEDACGCRKPEPGLFTSIAARFGVHLKGVPMAGDMPRDLLAATAVGCEPHLVRTGQGARRATPDATLPISARFRIPWPCVPSATSSGRASPM